MKFIKKTALMLAGLCCSVLMATAVSAAPIIDTVTPAGGARLVNSAQSYSYSHNINDNGFIPGSAISGSLALNIYDTRSCFIFSCFDDLAGEWALVVVEGFNFDTGGAWGSLLGSAAPGWANELGIQALLAMNADGFLDITISSLFGNFWVGASTLTVQTAEITEFATVPEPTILTMLVLGLFGMAGFSRRRRLI